MKKLFTILVLLTTFVTLNAQLNIAYFTKDKSASMDPGAGEEPVLTMLQADERFVVTLVTDASSDPGDLSGYDMVLLSEAVGSGDPICGYLKGVNNRFLNMKVYAYKSGVWSWGTADDGPSPNLKIKVIEGMESHPLFKDVTIDGGLVTLFVRGTDDYGASGEKGNNYAHTFAAMTGEIQRLAYPDGALEADAVSVQAVDDPTASIGGTTIPQKYVMLGFNDGAMRADGATNLTEDGRKIVMNAVEWILSDLLPQSGVKDNALGKNVNAYGIKGYIRINTDMPTQVTIYSIDGRIVKEATIHGSTSIPCKSGLYIVKVDGEGMAKVFVTK
ncbi:MAG: T9SS type A sorting domain-containing protein [Bacteroidales bacterium]|nr:T9SS type A sorting domain-containing protein [Bacteroidales bacterium]